MTNKIDIRNLADWIIELQEKREDTPFRITDKERMIKWIDQNFEKFIIGENTTTEWEKFWNNLMNYAYSEELQTWLEGIVYIEDENE